MHLLTDFKFERSLNYLFCEFSADILNFIVCTNKKAILPHFQDEMIRFPSRCLQEIKSYRIKLFFIKYNSQEQGRHLFRIHATIYSCDGIIKTI